MKYIEELSAASTTDIAVITPKAIAKVLEMVARPKVVFAQFFRENRDIYGPGKPFELHIPKEATGIQFSWGVSPGNTVSTTAFTYAETVIRVEKVGGQLRFPNEVLEGAMRDVMKDYLTQAGKVWKDTLDVEAYEKIVQPTSTTAVLTAAVGTSVATSTFTPFIKIVSVDGNTIDAVDYYGGTIYFKDTIPSSTVTLLYSKTVHDNRLFVKAKTAGSMSAYDLLAGRAKMVGSYYTPNACVISDEDLPVLLYDDKLKFLDASAYPAAQKVIFNAELGQLFGMRMVTTNQNLPAGNILYLDADNMGLDVRKRDLKGTRQDKPEYDSVWYHLWAERGFGRVHDNAIAMSVNHKSGQYPAK